MPWRSGIPLLYWTGGVHFDLASSSLCARERQHGLDWSFRLGLSVDQVTVAPLRKVSLLLCPSSRLTFVTPVLAHDRNIHTRANYPRGARLQLLQGNVELDLTPFSVSSLTSWMG